MSRARDTADQINRVNSSAADATAITVDSSENVMMGGHTSTHSPVENGGSGVSLLSNGQILAGGEYPSYFNRENSDGDIIVLRKDGTTVGSIGVNSGDQVYFAASDGMGIKVDTDNTSVEASNASGADNDNAVNLGSSGTRWKDLYLSGGVYLGGTALANKLDDYEQSSFTPEFYYGSWGYSLQRGDIIRIGNLVQVSMVINWNSSSATSDILTVQLPIQSIAVTSSRFSGCLGYVSGFDTTADYKQINPTLSGNSTLLNFYRVNDNTTPNYLTNSSCSGSGEVQIAITFVAV